MKTVIIDEPYHASLIEEELPVLKEGEALLRILYGGICGSDLGTYRGTFAYASYPRVPGHEFSAEVIDVLSNEKTAIKKGMIVVANPYYNCGTCYSCQRGLVNACENNQTLGAQRDGVFREYITMPLERIYDGQSVDPKALALVEPYCISLHGIKRANVKQNDRVLIIGAGTIGQMALIAALKLGAIVYIADISQKKLDYALSLGCHGVILNQNAEHFINEVQAITEHQGFDVTIEAVGLPSTFQNAIDAACYGGRVVVIGVGKKNVDFNFTIIQKKELSIFGSRNAMKKDFLETIQDLKNQKLDLIPLITHEYDLDHAQNAFADFNQHQGEMLKVMIQFANKKR